MSFERLVGPNYSELSTWFRLHMQFWHVLNEFHLFIVSESLEISSFLLTQFKQSIFLFDINLRWFLLIQSNFFPELCLMPLGFEFLHFFPSSWFIFLSTFLPHHKLLIIMVMKFRNRAFIQSLIEAIFIIRFIEFLFSLHWDSF